MFIGCGLPRCSFFETWSLEPVQTLVVGVIDTQNAQLGYELLSLS